MKIGISAWIQIAKVLGDVFMIAGMMNGVKLTAFGNSKSTLMIAHVRFVLTQDFKLIVSPDLSGFAVGAMVCYSVNNFYCRGT